MQASILVLVVCLSGFGCTAKTTMLSRLKCASQGRMSDTNRNLTAKTLLLLGELAKAMGPAFEGVGRPLLSTAVGNLSDSKSQV